MNMSLFSQNNHIHITQLFTIAISNILKTYKQNQSNGRKIHNIFTTDSIDYIESITYDIKTTNYLFQHEKISFSLCQG